MPVFWLPDNTLTFPHPELANQDGILAMGGDLSPRRLLLAYQIGIFPWFNPDDPIIWWSPDPRFVLFPEELKVAKSMRTYFNNPRFRLTLDQHFETIMRCCQNVYRKGQGGGTWITEDMVNGYCQLHKMGYAHSIEVWQDNQLVGGLYGIALGKCFFGESMFSKVPNASKFGFISLVRKLQKLGYQLIDCQQPTQYLSSLGARAIPRKEFLAILEKNRQFPTDISNWSDLLGRREEI
ncbi:MAG: leucyl/phenylalanyl-tRNA--protein transferase [Saprospiraceae bacterium]|nr:leucyl/phenylalanyl-tRNA--protein transferase [Saprospiraceae bacterium]